MDGLTTSSTAAAPHARDISDSTVPESVDAQSRNTRKTAVRSLPQRALKTPQIAGCDVDHHRLECQFLARDAPHRRQLHMATMAITHETRTGSANLDTRAGDGAGDGEPSATTTTTTRTAVGAGQAQPPSPASTRRKDNMDDSSSQTVIALRRDEPATSSMGVAALLVACVVVLALAVWFVSKRHRRMRAVANEVDNSTRIHSACGQYMAPLATPDRNSHTSVTKSLTVASQATTETTLCCTHDAMVRQEPTWSLELCSSSVLSPSRLSPPSSPFLSSRSRVSSPTFRIHEGFEFSLPLSPREMLGEVSPSAMTSTSSAEVMSEVDDQERHV